MGDDSGKSIEKFNERFKGALESYSMSLNISHAAKAIGMTRRQFVELRAMDPDLDDALRAIEDSKLDRIEEGVMNRALEDPGEAKFVLRAKRPKEWGGSEGGTGAAQVNIQVNLFPEEEK